MACDHVDKHWIPFKEHKIYTLAKKFTFTLGCRLFLDHSNMNLEKITELATHFTTLTDGIFSMPINFPGTAYYKAKKGGDVLREMVLSMVQARRNELVTSQCDDKDLLFRLLMGRDSNNQGFNDDQLTSKLVGYLFGGFYTWSSTIAFLMTHLAQHPHVFQKVVQEQLKIAEEIGKGKEMG